MKFFLTFDETQPPSDKTKRWNVLSAVSSQPLGVIGWFAPWRRYAFFPKENTLFDYGCLQAIALFIDLRMKDRKHERIAKKLS